MPRTLYSDVFDEEVDRSRELSPPTDADQLTAALMNMIRRTNFTVSLPAHQAPIIWSQPIDQSGQTTLAAAVGNYATVVQYTVPLGSGARILQYGVNVQDAAYTYNGSILWRFRVNGQPLSNGMSDWAQQRGSVVNPRDTVIILKEGDTLEFQVRRAVAAGAPQVVEMAFLGYTWWKRNSYEGTASSVTAF